MIHVFRCLFWTSKCISNGLLDIFTLMSQLQKHLTANPRFLLSLYSSNDLFFFFSNLYISQWPLKSTVNNFLKTLRELLIRTSCFLPGILLFPRGHGSRLTPLFLGLCSMSLLQEEAHLDRHPACYFLFPYTLSFHEKLVSPHIYLLI